MLSSGSACVARLQRLGQTEDMIALIVASAVRIVLAAGSRRIELGSEVGSVHPDAYLALAVLRLVVATIKPTVGALVP